MPKVHLKRLLKNKKAINLCKQMVELEYSPEYKKSVMKNYLNPFKRIFSCLERLEIEVDYKQFAY